MITGGRKIFTAAAIHCLKKVTVASVRSYNMAFRIGFPDSSVGKESACNAGDPGSIPGLDRSAGEGIGFPCISAGKESTCNAGDPGSIPGLEGSLGGGIGYPPQCSWVSLVAQPVKNLPTM